MAVAARHLVDFRWNEERFIERFGAPESFRLFNPGVVRVRRTPGEIFWIFVARGNARPYAGWHEDNYLFARLARNVSEHGVEWDSKLKKVELRDAFAYPDAHGAGPTSFEDVRLAVSADNEELYFLGNVTLTRGGTKMRRMAILTVHTRVFEALMRQEEPDTIPVPFVNNGRSDHNGVVPWLDEGFQPFEKNWSFFARIPEPPGTVTSCVIRSMDTMQVYEVTASEGDPFKRLCEFRHISAHATDEGMLDALEHHHHFERTILRGGTPGIPWGTNKTLFVGHAVKADDGQLVPRPMASGADEAYFRGYRLQYFFFFVVVKYKDGRFKIHKMSQFFRPRDPTRRPTKIIFPTGLVTTREDPYVHLFFGYEDGECRMVSYNKREQVSAQWLMPIAEFARMARVEGNNDIFAGDDW